jgi:hypothetical protein
MLLLLVTGSRRADKRDPRIKTQNGKGLVAEFVVPEGAIRKVSSRREC